MQRGYLRRIENLFGFRIGGRILNNIRHRVDDKHGRKTTGPPRQESKGIGKNKASIVRRQNLWMSSKGTA